MAYTEDSGDITFAFTGDAMPTRRISVHAEPAFLAVAGAAARRGREHRELGDALPRVRGVPGRRLRPVRHLRRDPPGRHRRPALAGH